MEVSVNLAVKIFQGTIFSVTGREASGIFLKRRMRDNQREQDRFAWSF